MEESSSMIRCLKAPVMLLALSLTGCGSLGDRFLTQLGANSEPSAVDPSTQNIANIYAARPLRLSYTMRSAPSNPVAIPDVTPALQTDFLGLAVVDSLEKCARFVSTLTASQATGNTVGGVTSIVLSGLAAVFTPAATVRALSAASSIVQGAQAEVNSEFFQQLTLVLFVQQINKSYYERLGQFRATTMSGELSRPRFVAALTELQEIHRECSIPAVVGQMGRNAERPTPPQGTILPGEIVAGAVFTNAARTEARRIRGGTGARPMFEVLAAQADGTPATPDNVVFRSNDPFSVVSFLSLRGFVTPLPKP